MANLIITIIGIALVAVGTIMAVLYLNVTIDSGQAQAWANAALSQNQQLFGAFDAWSLDHGGDTFSDIGFGGLVSQNYLSQWPNLVMFPPQPNTGSFTTGTYDAFSVCPVINGYQGGMVRSACTYNGQNVLVLNMKLNDPYNGTCTQTNTGYGYGFEDARYARHPYVQLALAINKTLGTVPASATLAGSGLPYAPTGSTVITNCPIAGNPGGYLVVDSGGNPVTNYCMLKLPSGNTQINSLYCQFTH